MALYIVGALVFGAAAGLTYAGLGLVFADDRVVSRRLKGLTDFERAQASAAHPTLAPFTDRVIAPAVAALGRVLRAIWPPDYRDRIAVKIDRAGRPQGVDVGRFVAAKVMCALGAAGLAVAAVLLGVTAPGTGVLLVVAATVLAFFAPDAWLSSELDRRQHRIVRDLPDMLDMLMISVEAGMGFDLALAKIVRTAHGPLAEEFGRALQEIQAGATRREALRHMAERVDVSELSAFTSSIIQADIFGISVAQVLRTQSVEMRVRRKQRAEEQAAKVPVKMVIPLTLFILPATLIIVGGPAALGIMGIFGN